MPLDVRVPIGGLFLTMGVLLLLYGLVGLGLDSTAGQLNAAWGGIMLVFGAILGYYGLRGERRSRKQERVARS